MNDRKPSVKGLEMRTRILAKALQLFNKAGAEFVGTREVAEALGLRPSHVTYYFPTKEDLVLALALELRRLNDHTVPSSETRSLHDFLARFEQVMRNHTKYRFLMLGLPRLLQQMPKLRSAFLNTQTKRQDDLQQCLDHMVAAGTLRPLSAADREYLISILSLVSRGWLVESVVSGHSPKDRTGHYVELIGSLLRPYEA
jgi:AcrR family transcriptional regulator